MSVSIKEVLKAAKKASYKLGALTDAEKNKALGFIASDLWLNKDAILEANKVDLKNAEAALKSAEINEPAFKRLALNEDKLRSIVDGIEQVAALPQPSGKTLLARQLDDGLNLYQITCPIGLVAVIFESRPDALPQIIALCLKSGNAAVLKGGKEAEATNLAIFKSIQSSIARASIDISTYALFHKREVVPELLAADGVVDLIIPRGSNELVRHIMDNTRIPVLGHAAGICHVYIDKTFNEETALAVSLDSKLNYPAACNAAEAVLVHKNIAKTFLPKLLKTFADNNIESRCDVSVQKVVQLSDYKQAKKAEPEDFGCEFSDLIVAIKVVDSIDDAITHINEFGSNHTESIVTEDEKASDQFFTEINSAGVYRNASTRFADGFRYGFGAEVGISNGKLHPRGPVGLEGLVTYKYKLIGNGHVVKDYSGPNAKEFNHLDISDI